MKRLVFVVFLFNSLLSYPVFAQQNKAVATTRVIDSLYAVLKNQSDDTNKINTLNKLTWQIIKISNYSKADSLATNILQLAEKLNFQKGVANAFKITGMIYFRQSNYQKALENQLKALPIYQEIENKQGIASTIDDIGIIYFTLGNYSKALECYFKVLPIVQEIRDTNTIAEVFCNIGIIYGEQGNQSKALEYLFKSLEMSIKKGNKDAISRNLGNIGYSYLMQGDYPKALEYDFKAVAQAQQVGNKAVIANFLGDIGDIYYKQGNYAGALEYDFRAMAIAQQIGDIDEVANLYSNTGEVYTKLKNYKQAKTFLDSALGFLKKTGNKKYIENTYGNLATLDSAINDYKTAYYDYKEYMAYRDSILNKGTAQMELSYEFEKREDSIRAEYKQENIIKTAEIKRKKILNDSAIVILTLTVLLAFLLINRQQVKRKKDKIISEKEKAALTIDKQRIEAEKLHMEAEKQRIADELFSAKKALEDYTKSMVEKNELLEQFKTDIEKLKNLKSKELEEVRIEQLEHLNKTTILTEDDWGKFKELFEEVYKGFFIRLKEKLPELTQAEIRLICLTKLKLETKQMAGVLGVSTETIFKIRYRLRKKLGLSKEDSILDID